MNHLTPEQIVDGLDAALHGEPQAHLSACPTCQQQVDDLRRAMQELAAAPAPEPSPLFWTHFAARVRQAIAEDPAPSHGWFPVWTGWRVALPLAALALLVTALVTAVPGGSGTRGRSSTAATFGTADILETSVSFGDDAFDDVSWQLVSDLADELDADEGAPVFGTSPGFLERAASDLEPAEREELLRLLRAELERPES